MLSLCGIVKAGPFLMFLPFFRTSAVSKQKQTLTLRVAMQLAMLGCIAIYKSCDFFFMFSFMHMKLEQQLNGPKEL